MKKVRSRKIGQWLKRISRQVLRLRSEKYTQLSPSPSLSLFCSPPKGHLTVYVGKWKEDEEEKCCRYVIPVIQINHPLFWELLQEAEAEFEFQHPRGITIPCSVSRFEHVQTNIAATVDRCPSLNRVLRRVQSFSL